MNDIEHELRELFDEKAREARIMPSAPPAVLKRGRRRQVGTVAIGATTAILVTVASVAVLRLVGPSRSITPGGEGGLGERTATIQNFTVTAPAGWMLIDWWPVSRHLATAVSSSGGTTANPPSTSLAEVVPVLQVSNFDPGLDSGLPCASGSQLGSTDAVFSVALDAANMRGHGLHYPSWPVALDASGAPEAGPCGNGYYARFSLGGYPYFAFVGFGSEVDPTVRQQTFDIYASMGANDAGLTMLAGGIPGYVMAAGFEGSVPWSLELGIEPTFLSSATPIIAWLSVLPGIGRSEVSGPGGLDDAQMIPVGSGGIVAGSVLPGADRVDYVAPDGSTTSASILDVPVTLIGSVTSHGGAVSDRIFEVSGDPANVGQIVQFVDGVPTTENIALATAVPSAADQRAETDLRNALVAALTYYTDGATFVGLTPKVAARIEPSLTYHTSTSAIPGEISIRDVSATTVLLVTAAQDGSVWCIANDASSGTTTYGVVDAQTAAECVEGEAAWGTGANVPSPTASPSASMYTLHGIETGTDLGVTWSLSASVDKHQYCVQFDAEGAGSGVCGAAATGGPPPGPSADAPAQALTAPVAGGEFVIESVPNSVDRVEVTASSGGTFTGICVDPPLIPEFVTKGIRFCVVPLPGLGDGTMRFLAADGSEPFPSRTISWGLGSTTATGSSGGSGP